MSDEIEQEESKQGIKNTVYVSKEQAEKIREVIANKEGSNQRISELETENKRLNDELLRRIQDDPKGGVGVLPSSLNGTSEGSSNVPSGTYEFDSHEAMIDYCRKERPEVITEMWKKTLKGFRESPNQTLGRTYTAPIITNAQGDVIDSPIRRTLSKQTGGNKK